MGSKLKENFTSNFKGFASKCLLGVFLCVTFIAAVIFIYNTVNDESIESKSQINYVFVKDQTVYIGDEQKIAVSVNDENSNNIYSLNYSNRTGNFSSSSYERKNNLLLFSLPFKDSSQVGAYSINNISWTGDSCGKEDISVNPDYGFTFSVTNRQEEDDVNNAFENASIYSISSDGNIKEENSIQDAIGTSKSSMIADNINPNSEEGVLRIALDAGHGGSDPGACSHGLVESRLNLEIAKSCYNELSLYNGVAPYLVRSTDETVELMDRVTRARDIGHASVFVSFHINSASPGATGFEIYIQNSSSWKYNLHLESAALAEKIRQELAQFGFGYRGTKEWDHPSDRDPSGHMADYLAVLRHSRYNDIAAILIEHLFISNDKDAAFLSIIQNQWALGRADATGIAKQYNLSKETYDVLDGTYIISPAENPSLAFDVANSSTADFANVQLNNNTGSNTQKWKIITDDISKTSTIINSSTGKALDLYGGRAVSGNNIDQYQINLSTGQKWKFVIKENGTYKIETCVNTNYVVDVCGGIYSPGTNLWVYSSNDSAAQRFIIKKVEEPEREIAILNGEYAISSNLNENMVVDVSGGSTSSEANVQLYQSNNTGAQKWKISTDPNTKLATIKNLNSGKVLDLYGGHTQIGTNIWQYVDNGSIAQKWKIYIDGDSYIITSALSPNICISVANSSATNCSNIQIFYSIGTGSTQFKMFPLKPDIPKGIDVEEGEYFISSLGALNRVVDLPLETQGQNGSRIQIWDKNSGNIPNQIFVFKKAGEGVYYIVNKKSQKVLDIDNGCVVPGTKLSQWDNGYTENQKWIVIQESNGYRIVNVASGLGLHLVGDKSNNGTKLDGYSVRENLTDRWQLQKVEQPAPVITSKYVLASKLNVNKVVEIYGGHLEDGAAAEIYDNNNSLAQKWEILTNETSGYSTIKNLNSNKVLDIQGGKCTSGAKICQSTYNAISNTQKWRMVKVGDYYKFLSSVNESLAIDIPGGNLTNFTQLQLLNDVGDDKQLFIAIDYNPIVPPTPCDLQSGDYYIKFKKNINKVIDLDMNTESINGGKLQVYSKNSSNKFYNQLFTISKLNDGYYRIANKCSRMSFDLDKGSPVPGTKVHQWESGETNNQKWAIEKVGESYLLTNVASGLCLSTNGYSDVDGSILCGQPRQSSPSTLWNFSKWTPEYTPIMHSPTRTADQMAALFNSYGKSYPAIYAKKGAPTIKAFCDLCVQEAVYEGVDPTILFAQAMHETGWLQFGGDVLPEQCNFGGLGATGGGEHGATFDNVQQGLCAQVQHLKCYASTAPLKNPKIYDPRWQAVIDKWGRGCAPNLEDLNGKWAVPGMWYAQSILNIIEKIV